MLLQRGPKIIKPGEIDLVQRPGIACNGKQAPPQVDDIGLRPFVCPIGIDDLLDEIGIEQSRSDVNEAMGMPRDTARRAKAWSSARRVSTVEALERRRRVPSDFRRTVWRDLR